MGRELLDARIKQIDQFEIIENIAETFLSMFPICSPPVPLREMARHLGRYSNNSARLQRDALGAFLKDEGLIVVDENRSTALYRFTLAHEIGHWILHGGGAELLGITKKSTSPKLLASTRSETRESRTKLEDAEANQFAAALLIPRHFLYQACNRYAVITEFAIRDLARAFTVSAIAMLYRLKNLDHYSWRETPPIDWPSVSTIEKQWKQSRYNRKDKSNNSIISVLKSALDQSGANASIFDIKPFVSLRKKNRRPRFAKKTKILEIDGLPNAGKNTLIDHLAKSLRTAGYKVACVTEGFEVCSAGGPMAHQSHPLKLEWAVSFTKQRLLEYGLDQSNDIVIVNRGPFDLLALTRFWYLLGHITKTEADAQTGFLEEFLREWIDIVVFLRVSPDEAIRREHFERREVLEHLAYTFDGIDKYPDQRIVEKETLKTLEKSYDFVRSKYSAAIKPVYEVNSVNAKQTAEEVSWIVRPQLKQKKVSLKKPSANRNTTQPYLPGFGPISPQQKDETTIAIPSNVIQQCTLPLWVSEKRASKQFASFAE